MQCSMGLREAVIDSSSSLVTCLLTHRKGVQSIYMSTVTECEAFMYDTMNIMIMMAVPEIFYKVSGSSHVNPYVMGFYNWI